MELSNIEIMNIGSKYNLDREPVYTSSQFYNLEKSIYYKKLFLDYFSKYNNNNFLIGDTNNNDNIDNGEDNYGLTKFINWFNKQIGLQNNQIVNNYSAHIFTEFIDENGIQIDDFYFKYRYLDIDHKYEKRGSYFFSKPIILPNNEFVNKFKYVGYKSITLHNYLIKMFILIYLKRY